MREFFKPWRRKFGVVTLGLACVLAAAWVRSYHVSDDISVGFRRVLYNLRSEDSSLSFGEFWHTVRNITDWCETEWVVEEIDASDGFVKDRFDAYELYWKSLNGEIRFHAVVVGYEALVLPLTLLSAWLLLSKPQSAKRPEPSPPLEPDHA